MMKKFIIKLFGIKTYKVVIIAHSTGTPTLDCSVQDLMLIEKGVHGNDEYVFKGIGADLIIKEA